VVQHGTRGTEVTSFNEKRHLLSTVWKSVDHTTGCNIFVDIVGPKLKETDRCRLIRDGSGAMEKTGCVHFILSK